MAQEVSSAAVDRARMLLVRCIEESFDSLRVIPGLDENGPVLMWMADHMLEAHRRLEPSDES
jgi:hypothetical protein